MSSGPAPFHRILGARESPQNGCVGPNGEWLVPATSYDYLDRAPGDKHVLVTLRGRHRNRFGWVIETTEPLTANSLREADGRALRAYLGDDAMVDLPDETWYQNYLNAVAKYEPGTPMTCHWRVVRGPGVKRRELYTHLVKFYPA